MEKQLRYTEKVQQWYAHFDKMKSGDRVSITNKSDPALFIEMCKDFIDIGHPDFDFTNDMKYFRRINTWPVN